MPTTTPAPAPALGAAPAALADRTIALVERWLVEARDQPVDADARRLAGMLRDPDGLAFTTGFIDGVVRPEDTHVAARNLRALEPLTPRFLPLPPARGHAPGRPPRPAGAGRSSSRSPGSRCAGWSATSSSTPPGHRLGTALRRIRNAGGEGAVRVNVNLLGEAILGAQRGRPPAGGHAPPAGPARRRLRLDQGLLDRRPAQRHGPSTSAVAEVDRGASARCSRLPRRASRKFINLDMEEYRDLDLTLAVFTAPPRRTTSCSGSTAGIVLQAYLPDALGAMHAPAGRGPPPGVARGGAPIKVRVVKGANLPMERVEAELHGWPLATWHVQAASPTPTTSASSTTRCTPSASATCASASPGTTSSTSRYAWLLAQDARRDRRGSSSRCCSAWPRRRPRSVRREVGSLLLYTPVVHPRRVRRRDRLPDPPPRGGRVSRRTSCRPMFELDDDAAICSTRERERFLASLGDHRRRRAARAQPQTGPLTAAGRRRRRGRFVNTPDTDPSAGRQPRVGPRRSWRRMRALDPRAGTPSPRTRCRRPRPTRCADPSAASPPARHGASSAAPTRAEVLHRAGDVLAGPARRPARGHGARRPARPLDQGDPEVSRGHRLRPLLRRARPRARRRRRRRASRRPG